MESISSSFKGINPSLLQIQMGPPSKAKIPSFKRTKPQETMTWLTTKKIALAAMITLGTLGISYFTYQHYNTKAIAEIVPAPQFVPTPKTSEVLKKILNFVGSVSVFGFFAALAYNQKPISKSTDLKKDTKPADWKQKDQVEKYNQSLLLNKIKAYHRVNDYLNPNTRSYQHEKLIQHLVNFLKDTLYTEEKNLLVDTKQFDELILNAFELCIKTNKIEAIEIFKACHLCYVYLPYDGINNSSSAKEILQYCSKICIKKIYKDKVISPIDIPLFFSYINSYNKNELIIPYLNAKICEYRYLGHSLINKIKKKLLCIDFFKDFECIKEILNRSVELNLKKDQKGFIIPDIIKNYANSIYFSSNNNMEKYYEAVDNCFEKLINFCNEEKNYEMLGIVLYQCKNLVSQDLYQKWFLDLSNKSMDTIINLNLRLQPNPDRDLFSLTDFFAPVNAYPDRYTMYSTFKKIPL